MNDAVVLAAVRAHWDGRAATFDGESPTHSARTDAQRRAWEDRIRRWAQARDGLAVDLGCGTGFLARVLARHGRSVVGVDVAREMLARTHRVGNAGERSLDVVQADVAALPMDSGSAALMVARHLVWTLRDPQAALAEWRRVLTGGGRLVLVEGPWGSHDTSGYDAIVDDLPLYEGVSSDELAALVADAGFDVVSVEEMDAPELWDGRASGGRFALQARRPVGDRPGSTTRNRGE